MKDLLILIAHLLTTIAKLLGPGVTRAIVADGLLTKPQLLIINRTRRRSPKLTTLDRFLMGYCSLFLLRRHIRRAAVIIRPSTLLKFHQFLKHLKYRLRCSSCGNRKPGPKGPSWKLKAAVVDMNRRNPTFGCPRIAQQTNLAFGITIDKDVVKRILASHYPCDSDGDGPSWLTFLGHTKDSLWSVDLFRCESILLKSHWVLVVMDQFTRRFVGLGEHPGDVDGVLLCCMFNKIISGKDIPRRMSSDNDPLFQYHQWQANLRILDIEEIKSVPYTPTSHPFIERLIGTIRREYLDQLFFWNKQDLERKLADFAQYYNRHRVHQSLNELTPDSVISEVQSRCALLDHYSWQSDCNGLFQTPIAA